MSLMKKLNLTFLFIFLVCTLLSMSFFTSFTGDHLNPSYLILFFLLALILLNIYLIIRIIILYSLIKKNPNEELTLSKKIKKSVYLLSISALLLLIIIFMIINIINSFDSRLRL